MSITCDNITVVCGSEDEELVVKMLASLTDDEIGTLWKLLHRGSFRVKLELMIRTCLQRIEAGHGHVFYPDTSEMRHGHRRDYI